MTVAGVIRRGAAGPLLQGINDNDVLAWSSARREWEAQPIGGILPGAPLYDVMQPPFNAVGNGIADDTAAINRAIAAANAVPGVVYLGPAHRITAALTPIVQNNVGLKGRGRFNGGTQILIDAPAAANFVTIGAQYCWVEDIWFRGAGALYSTLATIKVYGSFQTALRRLLITQLAAGVDVQASVLTTIEETTLGDLYGTYGIWFHGDPAGPFVAHALHVDHCLASTNFPLNVVGFTRDWAALTLYATGATVVSNGQVYQASIGGTSGAVAPSGIPGTTVATAHTATIVDGSVTWVWAMPLNDWYLHDSYADTFRLIDSGALQGGRGVRMIDTSASVSPPHFLRCLNVELDHVVTRGVSLEGGGQAEFEQLFITSMLNGVSVDIGPSFGGAWRINGGVFFASGVELVTVRSGSGQLDNVIMGGGGLFTANTFDAVRVDAGVSSWQIGGCSIGAMPGAAFPATRYGISIAAGCDNFVVNDNKLLGNATAPILNTPGVAATRSVIGNVPVALLTLSQLDTAPESTIAGRALGAGTGSRTNLTAAELGALIRYTGVVLDGTSTGTVNLYTIADGTTHVIFTGAGALTINGFTGVAGTIGKRVVFEVDQTATVVVTINNESGSAPAAFNRARTYNGKPLILRANQRAIADYVEFRMRFNAELNQQQATISVAVPALAAGVLGYLDVSTVGTALAGITTADNVQAAPAADLAAAGAAGGYYIDCRVSAADTVRMKFVGTLVGGATNFLFQRVN